MSATRASVGHGDSRSTNFTVIGEGPSAKQRIVAEGKGWVITTDSTGAQGVSTAATNDCGVIRCTLYLTRSQTRSFNTNINLAGGGIGGLAASCGFFSMMSGPAAPFTATVCGVEILIYGGFMLNAVSRAAGDNGCFAMSYGMGGFLFYDNHSSFCKN